MRRVFIRQAFRVESRVSSSEHLHIVTLTLRPSAPARRLVPPHNGQKSRPLCKIWPVHELITRHRTHNKYSSATARVSRNISPVRPEKRRIYEHVLPACTTTRHDSYDRDYCAAKDVEPCPGHTFCIIYSPSQTSPGGGNSGSGSCRSYPIQANSDTVDSDLARHASIRFDTCPTPYDIRQILLVRPQTVQMDQRIPVTYSTLNSQLSTLNSSFPFASSSHSSWIRRQTFSLEASGSGMN